MKSKSYLKSLMKFNYRVLSTGRIDPDKIYSIDQLYDHLRFNSIFLSNMEEVLDKFDTASIVNNYTRYLKFLSSNVDSIIEKFNEISEITISNESLVETKLEVDMLINDNLKSRKFKSIKNVDYKFRNNQLYYISMLKDKSILISTIDIDKEIYQKPILVLYKNKKVYCRTEFGIAELIKTNYDANDILIIKPSIIKNTGTISKIEYFGNDDFMKSISSIFGHTSIFKNSYLYIKNIDQIIKKYITPPELKQHTKIFNVSELFDDTDILIEYPFHSFQSHINFIENAIKIGKVKTIYMTLYRIGKSMKIYYLIKYAISLGIRVIINIELCARGESINYFWLKEFKALGATVITYQTGKIKVHCKVTLIEYCNGQLIAQIGTGNYHTNTTEQYTDLSLITADDNICRNVKLLFNMLINNTKPSFDDDLLVSRFNLRKTLYKLIDREAMKGHRGYIVIKCNALDDEEMINHLNMAALAGCRTYLIIRGVCTWIPKQLGDNVIIKSIVWDKLEHSRVYSFGARDPVFYIGSLDLITRKLDNRVEVLSRIKNPSIYLDIMQYLNDYIAHRNGSWLLLQTGNYVKEKNV